MKTIKKLKAQNLKEVASDWGVDYQTYLIKKELVETIKGHCEINNITQKELAKMVDGLTQDRVSKIFSGQVGTMTIDKLVFILSCLDYKVVVKAKAA